MQDVIEPREHWSEHLPDMEFCVVCQEFGNPRDCEKTAVGEAICTSCQPVAGYVMASECRHLCITPIPVEDNETLCPSCHAKEGGAVLAAKIYQAIHGQELIKAERITVERVRQELESRGLSEYAKDLRPKSRDRVHEITELLKEQGL